MITRRAVFAPFGVLASVMALAWAMPRRKHALIDDGRMVDTARKVGPMACHVPPADVQAYHPKPWWCAWVRIENGWTVITHVEGFDTREAAEAAPMLIALDEGESSD